MSKRILIIGAGISGLSTAYLLTSKGYRITIFATAFATDITSGKAAAFCFPIISKTIKEALAGAIPAINITRPSRIIRRQVLACINL